MQLTLIFDALSLFSEICAYRLLLIFEMKTVNNQDISTEVDKINRIMCFCNILVE